MKLFFEILFWLISRFFVGSLILVMFILIISIPIVHWMPVVSHIFVWFYIILIFLWLVYFWDNMINEFKDKKEENTK